MADTNYNAEYDEYSAMEAEADGAQQDAMSSRTNRAPQMNEQEVEYADEGTEEEVEDLPAPKPAYRPKPHTSKMNARARKPIPVINPNTGKSTEEELAEIEDEESEADAEADQLATDETMPKWMPFHQPEKIGLINTQTKEIIEGFKDDGSAAGMAKILNEIDVLIVSGGYQ